ncbi:MAG: carboxylating nicotinate-nucleotide diphosphorylase [Elusimicrobia bacterium]|nr:carboxylating nicotinate-nucleotide diphosphorylase [Candidatus Obscuribacterium magneticum]
MRFPTLKERLKMALIEDAAFGDITTASLPGYSQRIIQAHVIAKENGVLCGAFLLKPIFTLLDPKTKIEVFKKDGSLISKGQIIARIRAKAKAILGGERVFLTKAGHLSGIATLTRSYVRAVRGTRAKIYDTRKTTPLWRDLEKYAVRCGGGENHRFSLGDALMIKDNHHHYLRSLGIKLYDVYQSGALKKSRHGRSKFFEVEAKSFEDVWQGIKCGADYILLDNMSMEQLKGAITLIKAARSAHRSSRPQIEISGGVTLKNARSLAQLDVERISVGALTHSALSLDLSMEVA